MTRGLCALSVGLAVLTTCSGCGTMQNLQGKERGPEYYGGTAVAMKEVGAAVEEQPHLPHGWLPGMFVMMKTCQAVRVATAVVDVPLSVVFDTLTLPVVAVRRSSDTTIPLPENLPEGAAEPSEASAPAAVPTPPRKSRVEREHP